MNTSTVSNSYRICAFSKVQPSAAPKRRWRDVVIWQTNEMQEANIFRALSNANRLRILEWLKDPRAHFPPQTYGDLVADGVCGQFIADKLGLTASTLSEHMRVLVAVGLVESKRIRQWTFYKRDQEAMSAAARLALGVLTGEA